MAYIVMLTLSVLTYRDDYSTGARLDYRLRWDMIPVNINVTSDFVVGWIVEERIPYSGKLSREKTFTNFAIFQPSSKVFSTKF